MFTFSSWLHYGRMKRALLQYKKNKSSGWTTLRPIFSLLLVAADSFTVHVDKTKTIIEREIDCPSVFCKGLESLKIN